jgi:hypothetical protein
VGLGLLLTEAARGRIGYPSAPFLCLVLEDVAETRGGGGGYLNSTCVGTKRDGNPCTLPSIGSNGLCWAHDPTNAEKRRRGQSRGGRNKPSRELQAIKAKLTDLADDVLVGKVDRANAAVAGQLLNTVIRAVGVELKVREQLELVERLEAVERLLSADNEGSRVWG